MARLRPLGRELMRAEQLPPPRPPAPKPPHPPSSCANVTRSRLAVCKNEKNEDSAKTAFRHLPPGHFVRAFFDHPAGGNPYAMLYDTITESLSLCTVVY